MYVLYRLSPVGLYVGARLIAPPIGVGRSYSAPSRERALVWYQRNDWIGIAAPIGPPQGADFH
ncbi:uncharacterized protein N7518_010228 [Penicillium psychrosexuale]|uniref:uncharacterized protein n=1 Tax=Penicillium psychrosexuale TaxID=1002107 RepID=UPI0025450228|nr:uncharacterized protein N7518_010228 [Penicillium psychrosexuale]KAJ5781745.1 hypothetical protein N7518_010228 [Penicillium psychrosexuale]